MFLAIVVTIIVAVIASVVALVVISRRESKKADEATEKFLRENSRLFRPTNVVTARGVSLYIDDKMRRWAIRAGGNKPVNRLYYFESLVDAKLDVDGATVTKASMGRAAIGGLMFGGAGAVVGSSSRQKNIEKIQKVSIRLTTLTIPS